MSASDAVLSADTCDEIAALIAVLHDTGQRLEAMTSGEVDTVADREGRTFVLRSAQEHLRGIDAAKQVAILNALPAHIALVDGQGVIVSINEAWRRFTGMNAQDPGYGVGVNYLSMCDAAEGIDAAEAHQIANGIRAVLSGTSKRHSIEYPGRLPTESRRFQLVVTPLGDAYSKGAVIMHVDVTAARQTEENLRASVLRFRQMAENINDVFVLRNLDGSEIYYVSPAYEDIWGRTCGSLYDDPASWMGAIHPDDRAGAAAAMAALAGRTTMIDSHFRVVRPGGEVRWLHMRGFPIRDDNGIPYRTAAVVSDDTQRTLAERELRESERRFSDLLQNVELLAVMLDDQGCITYCNEHLLRVTGWLGENLVGHDWFALCIPPETTGLEEAFNALLRNVPITWHQEYEILTRLGERRLIRWNNSVLRSGDGVVIGTASIGEDITEQKAAELRIVRLKRLYGMLKGINALIVRVHSRDELFREACRIVVEVGGFRTAWIGVISQQSLDGTVVASHGAATGHVASITITARDDTADSERPASRALRGWKPVICNDVAADPDCDAHGDEVLAGHKAAAYFPVMVTGRPEAVIALFADQTDVFDAEESRLLEALAGDIAFALDHIEREETLHYVAYYDVLTGLANRSLFLERVAPYMRSAVGGGHKLAVFMIDLERFKNINDSLGQAAGDELLKQVAAWLVRNAGDTTLVARIGADHFAAVLPVIRGDGDLVHLLERMIGAFLNHPFHVNDAVIRIAAKGGVAVFPDDGANADTLLKSAEAALKEAKARGDRYLFHAKGMTETVAGKFTLEHQLRQAIERDEFVLHYQPKVNLERGTVAGAEALIRWNSPREGLVAPGQFIPLLEETGLIREVGHWALTTVIARYLRWRAAGLPAVRIAVNVSPLQLRDRGFVADVRRAIDIDPHAATCLELEITESVIMEDLKHNIASLQAIRAMGVRIAIDDFGTGFSSLSHLAKLPVDTLKVDRTFVSAMTSGPQSLALVRTIIDLAHSLKLTVVAEGVETEEQSRLLRLLGCDEMQGFLSGAAVPSEAFEARFLVPAPAND